MDLAGFFSGIGSTITNILRPDVVNAGMNFSSSILSTKNPSPSTIPPAGSSSFIDTALNAVTKIAGTGMGLVKAYDQVFNPQPQYVTGTPQILNLSSVNPGQQPPSANTSQVFNLPPNTISITNPVSTQGSQQTQGPSSMLWLIIALLVIVGLAIMKKGQ